MATPVWEPLPPCSDCTEIVAQLNRRMPQIFQSLTVEAITTLSVIPDADPETTSCDGYAYRSNVAGTTWAGIRQGAASAAVDNTVTITPTLTAHGADVDEWVLCQRGLFGFDLSAVPENAIISSASLVMNGKGSASADTFGGAALVFTGPTVADATALGVDDFRISNMGSVELTGRITEVAWRQQGSNTVYFNTAGIAAIQDLLTNADIFFVGARISFDFDDAEPTWGSSKTASFPIASADDGTYPAPTLVLTYQE